MRYYIVRFSIVAGIGLVNYVAHDGDEVRFAWFFDQATPYSLKSEALNDARRLDAIYSLYGFRVVDSNGNEVWSSLAAA